MEVARHDIRVSAGMQRQFSASVHRGAMSRRQRQFDELRDLCSAGAVARAIDLAFEHFGCFGRDDDIIDVIDAAIARGDCPGRASQRLDELRAWNIR